MYLGNMQNDKIDSILKKGNSSPPAPKLLFFLTLFKKELGGGGGGGGGGVKPMFKKMVANLQRPFGNMKGLL